MTRRPDGSLLLRVTLREGGRRQQTVRAEPNETPAQMRKRAQAVLGAMRAERDAGRTVRGAALTVAAFAELWLTAERDRLEHGRSKRRPTTIASHQTILTLYVLPGVGNTLLSRLSRTDVERMLDRLAALGLRATTIRAAKISLSVLLMAAHREGRIAVPLPTQFAEMPAAKVEARSKVVLDHAEVRRLLAEVRNERWEPLVAMLVLLGLRRGEVLGLGWGDLDLDAGVLSVRRSLVVVHGELVVAGTKTPKSRRSLPLDPMLLRVLRRWHVEQASERLAIGPSWGLDGWAALDLVFTNPCGEPLTPGALQSRLRRAATAAGLPPGIHPHLLRHTSASLALAAGSSVFDVAAQLGHTSAAMVIGTYGHALPGGRERAVAGVAAAVGAW